MAIVTIDDTYLTSIANAIRTKRDSSETFTTKEMANAILNIETGTTSVTSTYQIPNSTKVLPPYLLGRDVIATSTGYFGTGGGIRLSDVTHDRTRPDLNRLTTIQENAFYCQHSLVQIDLPATVTTIENGAFNELRGLSILILRAERTPGDYGYMDYTQSPFFPYYHCDELNGARSMFINIYVPQAVYDDWANFYPNQYLHKLESSIYA